MNPILMAKKILDLEFDELLKILTEIQITEYELFKLLHEKIEDV